MTVVSKKFMLSLVISDVNLMVGCSPFRYLTKSLKESSPCVQIKKISLMNLVSDEEF